MNRDAIVFAMANPTPEVMPEDAEPHVRIMATGRSDYPNQINNVLCFPGIFRGALDAGAPTITEEMKLAAAKGIAAVVTDDDLNEDYIIPSVFNRDVAPAVAAAVVEEAKEAGIARSHGGDGHVRTVAECPGTLCRGLHQEEPNEGPHHRSDWDDRQGGVRRAARLAAMRSSASRATPRRRGRANPRVTWHAWNPTHERPPERGLRWRRRGRQPGRRADQPALDRRGEAADPRESRDGDEEPRRGDAGRAPDPRRARQPLRGRLLRRPRRAGRRRVDRPRIDVRRARSASPGRRPPREARAATSGWRSCAPACS